MLFRPHWLGSELSEAMKQVAEVNSKGDLIKLLKAKDILFDEETLKIEHSTYDKRIEWDTYIVYDKDKVIGYMNGMLPD